MTGDDIAPRLAAWPVEDGDRCDPIGFARIDALARRTAAMSGPVRTLLDARLGELVDAYAPRTRHPRPVTEAALTGPGPGAGGLAALLVHLGRGETTAGAPDPTHAVATEALDEMRRLSTAVRTESQVRQALDQAPENAGPLNSANLVHRALVVMSEQAPGYLHAFMDYVDTLARLESMNLSPDAPRRDVGVAAASAKRRRRKASPGD